MHRALAHTDSEATIKEPIEAELVCSVAIGVASRSSSDLNLALEIEDAGTFELNAIAIQATSEFSAAARGLEGVKNCPSQSFAPIRCQHAMGRTSHGVFRYPLGRSKVTADEIVGRLARSSHYHTWSVD